MSARSAKGALDVAVDGQYLGAIDSKTRSLHVKAQVARYCILVVRQGVFALSPPTHHEIMAVILFGLTGMQACPSTQFMSTVPHPTVPHHCSLD